jgi:hypothetical protein
MASGGEAAVIAAAQKAEDRASRDPNPRHHDHQT